MEGKVSVITGGAQGLGLVMAQALATSGADGIALVDMNVEEAKRAAQELIDTFKAENSVLEKCVGSLLYRATDMLTLP
jgi:NAD(P)-dependent dehydrogenase (short-subunit alcohol dehydrogenase family)